MSQTTTVVSPEMDRAIRADGLVPAFQPVIDLESAATVGFEALARWPQAPGLTPDAVFAAAAAAGRTGELDWNCRLGALTRALETKLSADVCLFLNIEPGVLEDSAPPMADAVLRQAQRNLRVVAEITERSLLERPGDVLAQVEQCRARGWSIALDDVSDRPESMALLDAVAPDVVKLDLSLVQRLPAREQARTLTAVMAYRERFGVPVVAEGIETEAHLEQARALGADLGQGWLFGRPGPLPLPTQRGPACAPAVVIRAQPPSPAPATPFDLITGSACMRVARKKFLTALSRHIELQACNPVDPPVVLTAMQSSFSFHRGTRRHYEALSTTSPLIAIYGVDRPDELPDRVRWVPLQRGDPLVAGWAVIALGAQTAVALLGRDRGDGGSDQDRRFDYVVTYDRRLVTQAARCLLARLDGTA